MQRQRFLALALAAAGLVAYDSSAAAQADSQPTVTAPADSGRRMMDPVSRLLAERDRLELTDDQARQLEAIRTKYQAKHQGRMEQMRRDRAARSAFRASMDSARAEIAAVLTPEQEKQVEEMRKQWMSERHRHGGRDGHRDMHRRHHGDDDSKEG
jgi:Spy/CpxP family protein refolding chaperone